MIAICVAIELAVQFAAWKEPCTGLNWCMFTPASPSPPPNNYFKPETLNIADASNCPTLDNVLVIIVGGIPVAMPTVLSVTM